MAVLEAYRAFVRPLPGVGRREAPRPSLQYQARQRERMRELGLLPEAPPSPLEVMREREAMAERERAAGEEMQIRAEERAIAAARAEREEQREYEREVAERKHRQALELAQAKTGAARGARREVLGLPPLPTAGAVTPEAAAVPLALPAPPRIPQPRPEPTLPGVRGPGIYVEGIPAAPAPTGLTPEQEAELRAGARRAFEEAELPPAVAGPPAAPELRVPALPGAAPAAPITPSAERQRIDLMFERGLLTAAQYEAELDEITAREKAERVTAEEALTREADIGNLMLAWKSHDPAMSEREARARAVKGQLPPLPGEPKPPKPTAREKGLEARMVNIYEQIGAGPVEDAELRAFIDKPVAERRRILVRLRMEGTPEAQVAADYLRAALGVAYPIPGLKPERREVEREVTREEIEAAGEWPGQ